MFGLETLLAIIHHAEQLHMRTPQAWDGNQRWWLLAHNRAGAHPPPLYKLRPCPSYSRRRDRINLVPNFNSVPNVVQPHKTWA